MFGIIYGLVTLLGSGYEHIRRSTETKHNKEYCEKLYLKGENPNRVYYDWQGHERDLITNKKVITYYKNGHYYKAEVEGKVLEDITETRKRKETIDKLRLSNEDTIKYMSFHELQNQWKVKKGKNIPIIHPPQFVSIFRLTRQFCYEGCVDFTRVHLNNKKDGNAASHFIKLNNEIRNGNVRCWKDIHTGKIIALNKNNMPNGICPILMKPDPEEWYKDPVPVSEDLIKELINKYNELVDKGLIVSDYANNPYLELLPDKFEC